MSTAPQEDTFPTLLTCAGVSRCLAGNPVVTECVGGEAMSGQYPDMRAVRDGPQNFPFQHKTTHPS